ncbi:MAG: conjugal transfer protein TraX [Bacilli bacterium]|nr:conjugal transfer protein TraX [Bacilli bacterium]
MKKRNFHLLNSLALKIIAAFTMSLDHIGLLLMTYSGLTVDDPAFFTSPLSLTGHIFCCIGRLALPLFALLFAEAMRHSHDKEKYLAKMGLMTMIIMIPEVIMYFVWHINFDNIFLSFVCAASFILLIERKDKKSVLAIIPLIVVIMGFTANLVGSFNEADVLWWPTFLRPQYDLYGFLMMVGFYFLYQVSDYYVLSVAKDHKNERPLAELRSSSYYRSVSNILWAVYLLLLTLFFWLLSIINYHFDIYSMPIQSYVLFAIIPILLYNGKRGYKNKYLQLSFYLYYPIHLGIIVLGFFLGFGYLPGL